VKQLLHVVAQTPETQEPGNIGHCNIVR